MKKRSILIGIFLVAAIVAVCFFAVDKTPTLTLKGPEEVELTLGQEFHEDGYTATDYRGNVITAIVKKEMPDLNIVGDQFIKYSVTRNGYIKDFSSLVGYVGDFYNILEWVSKEEAEEMMREGV